MIDCKGLTGISRPDEGLDMDLDQETKECCPKEVEVDSSENWPTRNYMVSKIIEAVMYSCRFWFPPFLWGRFRLKMLIQDMIDLYDKNIK